MKPLWLSYNTVCELLCLERNGLRSLMRREKLFPKAFKLGTSRQAAVYFDREEIETWYQDFKERYRGEK
ncbi:AlpA family phage regulatory protein [Acinetobacter terrae]|uniref:AlpA family phage regulatory protein n=2 Tax=Acinetobacter terrae TaxID=2731247 RepID=A0A4R0EMH5_9GAMM|nr:AlpA family phage regulatory protein [Acinetobacter terrae]